jgi:vesicle coat complex subunit
MNCVGKLELIDRPAGISLSAGAAEFVFGSITYDIAGDAVDQRLLPLATITVSAADHMAPSQIEQASFRKKWDEFEWEKKQPVFVEKICRGGRMQIMQEADVTLPFLTTNLYSRLFFGEEVLANVNVEPNDKKVTGFIQLRTDSQAMALAFARLRQSIE